MLGSAVAPVRLSESEGSIRDSSGDAEARATAAASDDPRRFWLEAFRTVRGETERRAALLSAEDQVVQSMPDASPTKWHRAHVTWFFEEFLLRKFVTGYQPFDERFGYLFNSYYVSAGPRHARPQRGMITRPGAAEVITPGTAFAWNPTVRGAKSEDTFVVARSGPATSVSNTANWPVTAVGRPAILPI